MKKQKKRPENLPRRTLHLDARVTPEEYEQVRQRAEECGMTVSKYTRKCTLGHQPKYHLTEQEIEAYNQIGDARGDIVQFFNMFNSIEAEERQPLFSSAIFMRTWIEQLTKLATELQNILNKRKE